jgi:acyl-CoA thioester hydrolase
MPAHHKIVFHSEIFNEQNQLLNVGEVSLYFLDAATRKRCVMPENMKEKVSPFFKQ